MDTGESPLQSYLTMASMTPNHQAPFTAGLPPSRLTIGIQAERFVLVHIPVAGAVMQAKWDTLIVEGHNVVLTMISIAEMWYFDDDNLPDTEACTMV